MKTMQAKQNNKTSIKENFEGISTVPESSKKIYKI